jgi:MOSC domain-containing protein YiiM
MKVGIGLVVSLNLGSVRSYRDEDGKAWKTALIKMAEARPVRVGRLGLEGDAVSNTIHHGGEQKAVSASPVSHYEYWRSRFGLVSPYGGLGENLSLDGLNEDGVCVGDIYEIGTALLQVSQPREPCATLGRYWACAGLVLAIWESCKGGWYFRVLREGMMAAGDGVGLVERPWPSWSVARVLRALRDAALRPEEAEAASRLETLSPDFREKLGRRAEAGSPITSRDRLASGEV